MGTYYFLLHLHNTYKASSQTTKKGGGRNLELVRGFERGGVHMDSAELLLLNPFILVK